MNQIVPKFVMTVSEVSLFSNGRVLLGLAVLIVFALAVVFYLSQKGQGSTMSNLIDQAKKMKEQATEITEIAQDKIDDIIQEYKRILPYMEELGLRVEGFSIEAGVLPQVRTSLVGSIDNIEIEAIEKIKGENKDNNLLIAILNAVQLAKKTHEKLEDVYISVLKDIVIDIKLGIPPSVSIRFQ